MDGEHWERLNIVFHNQKMCFVKILTSQIPGNIAQVEKYCYSPLADSFTFTISWLTSLLVPLQPLLTLKSNT